ncbi:hypothetical protein L226DRAFT_575575 [Lentinus tigrinus ALCF2SS1-7]|uniref:uncharacterized protein n=1 Tax=Lentinus tigrinus ALCF2SS1-7 TaxID=1328758 RepID=UPI0011660376|nr:hypothetical protein L226DRAFT_575575 [Lentinus tigrinus ALCF2SS1-7]
MQQRRKADRTDQPPQPTDEMAAQPESDLDMTPETRRPSSAHFLLSSSSSPSTASSSSTREHRRGPSSPPSFSSAMASVPSSSTSRSPHRPRHGFKPKFPLDPFAGASAAALGEPWFLKIDALLSATALQRRNVTFVLGAPSLKDLAPLLQSRHLAKSLVILATHNPPDIPGIVIPTVRVLRLSAPLALEDAGAVRFVNVLEWAERVARSWRKHGGGGVLELFEDADLHADLVPPSMSRFGSQSTPSSPGSSSTHLESSEGTSSRPSSRPSSMMGSFFSRRGSGTLPPPDPSQRPFDVLINFMPEKLSDKALLKNSILVTTISRPFLTSTVHPTPPTLRSTSSSSNRLRPQSIFGAFSRSSSSVYMPPTPPCQSGESLSLAQLMPAPPGKAILIHLLPPPHSSAHPAARRKLVESMESFLLSFAFHSAGSTLPPPGSGGSSGPMERARPYIMQAFTFCDSVGTEPGVADYGDWTVADVVLSGALDADTPTASTTAAAPPIMTTSASVGALPKLAKSSRRAWIATAADLVIMPSTDDPSTSLPAPLDAAYSQSALHHKTERTRSTSAPLLSTSAPGTSWSPNARPVSHPALLQVPTAMARHGKGAYGPSASAASTSPSLISGGLPTPPHSEESAEGDEDPGASKMSVALVDRSVPGSNSGSAKSPSGKRERQGGKWKFWRRLGHGHHAQPAALKA